jgi:hypothetical protein
MVMLDTHLAGDEDVLFVSSAATRAFDAAVNSVVVLTVFRVLFIAPSPQVLGWGLPSITKLQVLDGRAGQLTTLFVEAGENEKYQLGIDSAWGAEFVRAGKAAVARAVLARL